MSQEKNPKDLTKNLSSKPRRSTSARPSKELQEFDYSGTMDTNIYYETGKLPENEADRKIFQDLIEKGLI